jgi:carbamoyltransferase
MKILGVRFGHDSSAALIIDGKIVADVAEERFSRIKNDTSFPVKAIEYCLKAGGIKSKDLDVLTIPTKTFQKEFAVFFDIPEENLPIKESAKQKFKNNLKKALGIKDNLTVLPIYQKQYKLSKKCKIELVEHHLAHVASAAYTSGIDINKKVLGVTMDGIGDDTSVALWRIQNNQIENLARFNGSGSIGWFYANSTEAMGWRHGSEEWKVMGYAPYGIPQEGLLRGYYPEYKDGNLIKPHNYGDFGRWADHGSNHYHGKDSIPMSKIFEKVKPEDFSAEVQRVSEEQAFKIILPWLKKENTKHLVCAGGFFMNVKFNQNLWYKGVTETQWIYPNPGDAGLAVGASLFVYYKVNSNLQHTGLDNLYFGPEYSNDEIKKILDDRAIAYEYYENIEEETAKYLSKNLVVGWFQGRMEAGPRALGNRSILMSPLDPNNKDRINAKVKYREKFRPFCPSIADEMYEEYLVNPRDELFMVSSFEAKEGMKERIPAVIHEDNTARPQRVKPDINPRYHKLITEFGKITGESILLNTSFNIKGEPVICNPREAIKCFYDTGLDVLVLGNYLIRKSNIVKM